jgi:glycosyltransferase involved in cell wall biosynthesis
MKKLAVLLPTYNAELYLNESIDSILNQTFSDFDLYVYDDCSTDNTEELISKYNDNRLFYRKNIKNSGISITLNNGLEELLPYYEYIARMDADDWSYPERFQKQMDYLEQNQDVILCGTQGYWIKDINEDPSGGWEYPNSNEYIKNYLLFAATFNHQSIIFQSKSLIDTNLRYDEKITTCEDWEMWTRMVKVGKIVNLPDFLIKCRILPFSNHHSPLNKEKHLQERSKIISDYWADFNIILSPDEIFEYYYANKSISPADFIKKSKILIRAFNLLYENTKQNLFLEERNNFSYMLARRILDFWKRSKVSKFNPMIWMLIVKEVTFMNKIKLIKSIIR